MLKTNERRERKRNIFFCSLECSNWQWVGGWGVACGRRSYLGPAEISSFVVLV